MKHDVLKVNRACNRIFPATFSSPVVKYKTSSFFGELQNSYQSKKQYNQRWHNCELLTSFECVVVILKLITERPTEKQNNLFREAGKRWKEIIGIPLNPPKRRNKQACSKTAGVSINRICADLNLYALGLTRYPVIRLLRRRNWGAAPTWPPGSECVTYSTH